MKAMKSYKALNQESRLSKEAKKGEAAERPDKGQTAGI